MPASRIAASRPNKDRASSLETKKPGLEPAPFRLLQWRRLKDVQMVVRLGPFMARVTRRRGQ
jgi:hypothetical protein